MSSTGTGATCQAVRPWGTWLAGRDTGLVSGRGRGPVNRRPIACSGYGCLARAEESLPHRTRLPASAWPLFMSRGMPVLYRCGRSGDDGGVPPPGHAEETGKAPEFRLGVVEFDHLGTGLGDETM